MRKNLPVTDREITFSRSDQLISSTDLKGKIVHVNDVFVDVSGFSREELIGQPHNIVRHPDMPSAAYENMWRHLKAGKAWMGLVKNRCKNGDYYWVDAYVTPVTENGQVVGYESVRSCPSRDDVKRAQALYDAINGGKSLSLRRRVNPIAVWAGITAIGTALGAVAGTATTALSIAVVGLVILAVMQWGRHQRWISVIDNALGTTFRDDLAVHSYTDDPLPLGRLRVGIRATKSHLNAVLKRMEDAASHVDEGARDAQLLSQEANAALDAQQAETAQVATAMNEMTATISEVSQSVQSTADKAEEARGLAENGQRFVSETRKVIENLKQTVDDISHSVSDLSAQTRQIATAAEMIEAVAEQTNLLALNAAIEAARAGSHGRGFAVVADEVRSLAKRTQTSTGEIHGIVNRLIERASASVKVADHGTSEAEQGLTRMLEAEQTLNEINSAVGGIADMGLQMAASVEEQAQVSEQINEQVTTISMLAENNATRGKESVQRMETVRAVAKDLHELVVRFQ